MSVDDSGVDYTATDWQARYNEVADMLEQTRAELDDFHVASKELEAELESELQRTERAQKDLMVKVSKAEVERDDWKSKFMSLQTTHNTTTTSLQRELDQLRHEHQKLRVEFRELEMGNDDLERNERAVTSNLADVESKYQRALEEKILLEQELLEKANIEEESQRLRDELRDAVEEASILKDKLAETAKVSTTSLPQAPTPPMDSQEDLLKTPPPADMSDLLLSELDAVAETTQTTPKATQPRQPPIRSNPSPSRIATPSSHGFTKITASPSIPTPIYRKTPLSRNSSTTSSSSSQIPPPKNKGVQMVSEMRARVKNLEQRIHTRVPRMRMGTLASRASTNLAASTYAGGQASTSSSRTTAAKSSWDSLGNVRRSLDSKKALEAAPDKKSSPDSNGWVLIMEDSPSPQKSKVRERRRATSPSDTDPIPFRPSSSTAQPVSRASPTLKSPTLSQSIAPSGLRRPGSRLSGASTLSSATSNSIPTPASRPTTPTYLPLPNGGGLKRSMGPPAQTKRSSLGASTNQPLPKSRERPTTMPPLPTANGRRSLENGKSLPSLPSTLPSSVTIRSTKPVKSGSAALSKSRIGRPSGGSNGVPSAARRSFDEGSRPSFPEVNRPRSSSTAVAAEEEIDETEMF